MSKKVYLLWFGQTVSWTGSAMSFFAIGVWIYETTGKASALSTILFIVAIVGVITGPFGGANTPPNGPVITPTIATINNIDESALALPVVSYIQTPIAKKDIAEPVQEIVCPNHKRYTFLLIMTFK